MPDSVVERLQAALAHRYAIERQVGEGGMANVFLATDLRHQRKVALKVLRPELAATMGPHRFLQEVRVTANLQHPHILPLFDSGEADGFLFYVMPFLDGESLRERVAREGELPVPEVVKILTEVVDALAAAHALGVVHRDIKPDNVLLSGRHVVVTDFGVAKAVSEATGRQQLTTVGVALGTPAYMAPEQAAANENIDHRADIYAVGVMGYELLTGRPPFAGRSPQQVLAAQVTERPQQLTQLRPATPPELEAVLMRCLEKKPADRWQSAEALLAQLEQFITPGAGMTPTQMQPTGARPRSRMPTWAKVAVPVVVLGAATALWTATRERVAGNGATRGKAAAPAAAEEARRLVVMPFRVLGGSGKGDDAVWAQLAAEWIARGVDGPRPVDVVPASTVRDAIQTLGDSGTVDAVARRLSARYAAAGTLARTGSRVRFEVEFLDESTGERLRSMDPVTGPADSMEAVVARLADAATATAVSLFDPDAPPWVSTMSAPPSLDVYQDYLDQGDLFCRRRFPQAIEAGNRVLARVPDFIPVLQINAEAYALLGRPASADSVHRRLLDPMRDRMTEMERAFDDFSSGDLYGDPARSVRGAERLYQIAPSTWGIAAGLEAMGARRLNDALTAFLAVDVDSPCVRDWAPLWSWTSFTYHLLGRYDEQLDVVRRGLARFPDNLLLLREQVSAFAALGRLDAVDSMLDVMAARFPPGTILTPFWAGEELIVHGHEKAADEVFTRLLAPYADASVGSPDVRAFAFYLARRWEPADTAYAALLANVPDNQLSLAHRGVTLAELGRRDEARALDARLAAIDGPFGRGLRLQWRAQIAAALGDKDDAVHLVRQAFDRGLEFNLVIHLDPAFDGMRGYGPWEALLASR